MLKFQPYPTDSGLLATVRSLLKLHPPKMCLLTGTDDDQIALLCIPQLMSADRPLPVHRRLAQFSDFKAGSLSVFGVAPAISPVRCSRSARGWTAAQVR